MLILEVKLIEDSKNFSIKKISKQELLKYGYPVYKKALTRYEIVLQKLTQKQFNKGNRKS